MRNTTFEMSVNGVAYRVFNGTEGDCVKAENIETGIKVVVCEDGTYANKTCVRRAILRHIDEFEQTAEPEADTEYLGEYGPELEEAREECNEFEDDETPDDNSINDVIYRNLPKYVQITIDYCDYVDGVYRIHVNTEHGDKEIAAAKWAEASARVKSYCKTGEEA